ncbi:hypothetical protein M3I53_24685 [Paraburkholderia sp. CNPSo 3272]|uniref:hypothetical protein n=1 Tax=Paraburkholderia sp. CNPSo 3272 TaxID=2940931 RepID=UPI0020B6D85D|nr:hypothetical protein [Paraburkholderia sp. CNPSo 3272]MCP3726288.1 hypothetical protein [Paraburkholderia sp. CNPSo 3272]
MNRLTFYLLAGLAGTCVSTAASAHADIGVYLGVPGPVYAAPEPVYEAPPPVVYAAPPAAVYEPAPAYGYYRYDHDEDEHHWHDHGRHRGWEHHHGDDD